MGNEDFGLAKDFLAGAGVREFGSEGLPCDKKCEEGDNQWRNSSKERRSQVLQLLQRVLSRPLTEDCEKYLPTQSPVGVAFIVLDEQEQKLHTYLLDGGIEGLYADDLIVYQAAHIDRRPGKKAILLSFLDLSQSQASC